MLRIRPILLALAFAATVGAAITGASLSGQTRESSLDEACRFAVWPDIPTPCLQGAVTTEVRKIAIEAPSRRGIETGLSVAFAGG